jgi:hypothetical protein
MKNILFETAPAASIAILFAALPATAMAHAGLDQGSAIMLRLHSLAHALIDHPLVLIVLTGALTSAYGLYRWASASRRHSD